MEKQQKVLNRIKSNKDSCRSSTAANNAKKNPNDECYTSMQDILNELSYWAALGKFTGKKIVCPCDWDIVDGEDIYGIEIDYKENPAEISAFKSVKSVKITKVVEFPGTLFETSSEIKEESVETKLVEYELREDEIEDFLRDKLTCNFVRTLTQNARRWGIKSITASGYNPATDRGIKFQDVDYSKYDICITNPPFSLKTEFMAKIVDHIDFIVLLPFMCRNKQSIGIPLMLNKAYIGHSGDTNSGYIAMTFKNPIAENGYSGEKLVACDWITSFSDAQTDRNMRLSTRADNEKTNYSQYLDDFLVVDGITMKDGTHPIKVPVTVIPKDYYGWMYAAVNVLTKISFDDYEWYSTDTYTYFRDDDYGSTLNPYAGPSVSRAGNKNLFGGIVFRKKKKVD